ncbi:TetR/AcrR family transcriptional regulator [Mucilaginibacter sabulilitoris]|uniref:TetR/AcrR family transcriptional regulator n=1 Tax=Mucilaginibacter sabulilitoris TaxID=1173583 RepID=A0ABZ0TKL3_9SPHI|nr:TetR/AcrR family transcriptional regulator [Mucilaginibacter sabulilitoris]WPU91720.1 TetR/AcrR family transcriptional regulator [Mucilaginibacter sabulilitoris]
MKDKEQTKRKLIDAVGAIIKSRGFGSIRISKVARQAGVDRKLIYRYFGNMNNLTEAYIVENDYWMVFAEQLNRLFQEVSDDNSQLVITETLQGLFKYFYKQPKMQNLILIELTGSSQLMRSIHNVRESMGQDILEKTDMHFKNSGINFRAVAGLLIGGIYYMVLHTLSNGYNFADVDLESEEGMKAVSETLANVVDWAFKAAANH